MSHGIKSIPGKIFDIDSRAEFERCAVEVFRFQAENCPPYAEFLKYLDLDPENVDSLAGIPYLPIEFFKSRRVYVCNEEPEAVFTSSGTTGSVSSRHEVADLSIYIESFMRGFEYFYGSPHGYVIFALLPSYLERQGSSLVLMAEELIKAGNNGGGFYLNNYDELILNMEKASRDGKRILLLGVSYALWDLAENYTLDIPNLTVMETGGMKGRREEITRKELHDILSNGLGVDRIHSEYGMTELLSQAYSDGDGLFRCPPWMRIAVRDIYDPLDVRYSGGKGGINIIDLANIYSCSFIQTEDLGILHEDGSFTVAGRIDHSDIRGCNLMIAE
ncbi:MAG: acyltransferase [Rikenellaceae bacterium]|nr:acyltransferase [Rikenellaceae bacterium]